MQYGHLKANKIYRYYNDFIGLHSPSDLSRLFRIPLYKLQLLSLHPEYETFTLRKKNGTRLIEAPTGNQMKFLKKLKNYLQSAYFYLKSDAAYGFILNPANNSEPRNILTNAQKHLNNRFMVNIDLHDFFHQIKTDYIRQIFGGISFRFNKQLTDLICRLTCINGRLPMGSPTSPPLSNFAMITTDNQLLKWARKKNITFTRFVDDLTFSGDKPFKEDLFGQIEEILYENRWIINYKKVRFFNDKSKKEVTGLQLTNRIEIPDIFFSQLKDDIDRLRKTKEMVTKAPFNGSEAWMKKLEQSIRGQVNFVGMIYGYGSPEYEKLNKEAEDAIYYEAESESLSWLDFPYQFT